MQQEEDALKLEEELRTALAQEAPGPGEDLELVRARLVRRVLEERLDHRGQLLGPAELAGAYAGVQDLRLVKLPDESRPRWHRLPGRRRQLGSFYTPPGLVEEVLQRTLAPLLTERRGDAGSVLDLRILDPALGGGGFLVACLEHLVRAAGDPRDATLRAAVAERCLFGVDRDPAAVQVAALALARAAGLEPGVSGGEIGHLRHGDALLGAPRVLAAPGAPHEAQLLDQLTSRALGVPLPTPAVHWELHVPEVFPGVRPRDSWATAGDLCPTGFDAVVGNPPYLQEARGNRELFRLLRRSPMVAAHCERMTDLFHLFICLSLTLLREGGRLGFLVPDYWLTRTGASRVREALAWRQLEQVVLFGDRVLFPEAPGHHSSILVVENRRSTGSPAEASVVDLSRSPDTGVAVQVHPAQGRFLLLDPDAARVLHHLERGARFHLPRGSITNGLQSYPDRLDGAGVFLLTPEEVERLGLGNEERRLLRPWVRAAALRPCTPARSTGELVLYLDRRGRELVRENPGGRFSRVRTHLERFQDRITSGHGPYGLHRPRQERFFTRPGRLLLPRKAPWPIVAPVDAPLYGDESINFIDAPEEISRPGLLGVLASSLTAWFCHLLKRQGRQLQLDAEVVRRLPLPEVLRGGGGPIEREALRALEAVVVELCARGSVERRLAPEDQDTLDRLVVRCYGLPTGTVAVLAQSSDTPVHRHGGPSSTSPGGH